MRSAMSPASIFASGLSPSTSNAPDSRTATTGTILLSAERTTVTPVSVSTAWKSAVPSPSSRVLTDDSATGAFAPPPENFLCEESQFKAAFSASAPEIGLASAPAGNRNNAARTAGTAMCRAATRLV